MTSRSSSPSLDPRPTHLPKRTTPALLSMREAPPISIPLLAIKAADMRTSRLSLVPRVVVWPALSTSLWERAPGRLPALLRLEVALSFLRLRLPTHYLVHGSQAREMRGQAAVPVSDYFNMVVEPRNSRCISVEGPEHFRQVPQRGEVAYATSQLEVQRPIRTLPSHCRPADED